MGSKQYFIALSASHFEKSFQITWHQKASVDGMKSVVFCGMSFRGSLSDNAKASVAGNEDYGNLPELAGRSFGLFCKIEVVAGALVLVSKLSFSRSFQVL